MTAPLPPLPELGRPFYGPDMQSYAKLAVREALERAAKKIGEEQEGASDIWAHCAVTCASHIRAMIEELDK